MLLSEYEKRHTHIPDYNRSKKCYSAKEAAEILGVTPKTFLTFYDKFIEYGMVGLDRWGLPSLPLPMITVGKSGEKRFKFSWWDIKLLIMWNELRLLKGGTRLLEKGKGAKAVKWDDEKEEYILIFDDNKIDK